MKNRINSFVACLLIFSGCSTTNVQDCPEMICTQEFRMVQVKFNDAQGNPVVLKEFSAVNTRTNTPMAQNNEPATINNRGIYTVASDADVRNLSETGDTVRVTGTHPSSNEILNGQFVISGGACACHISKVSGPEVLQF